MKLKSLYGKIRSIDVIALVAALSCVVMGVFFYSFHHSRLMLACAFLPAVAIAIAWAWYRLGQRSPADVCNKLFPVALTTLSLVYAFAFPPGVVPDEPFHFRGSYAYSNCITNPQNINLIRAEDEEALNVAGYVSTDISEKHFDTVKESSYPLARLEGTTTSPHFDTYLIQSFNPSANPPQTRIAAALGITLAKLLGLSSLWLFYLGVLFNMAFGIVLISAAVRITPVGKTPMMVVAILPMTLHLLGSYSYDVSIIGFSFLLTAFLLRAMHAEDRLQRKELVFILVLGCLLAPCKLVYTPIVFLAALIPLSRFESRRKGLLSIVCMIVVPCLFGVLVKSFDVATMAGATSSGSDVFVRGDDVGYLYTLHDLISNPVHTISIMIGYTPIEKGWQYLEGIVGTTPGWFQSNVVAPDYIAVFLFGLLVLSALSAPDDELVLNLRSRALCVAIVFIASLGIVLSMFLGWTLNTEDVVLGIQGRYFLPVMPLLLLAIRGNSIVAKRRLAFAIMVTVFAIDITNIAFVLTYMYM